MSKLKLKNLLLWLVLNVGLIALIIAGGPFGIVGAINLARFFIIFLAIGVSLAFILVRDEIVKDFSKNEGYPLVPSFVIGLVDFIIGCLFVWYGYIFSAIAVFILYIFDKTIRTDVKAFREKKSCI